MKKITACIAIIAMILLAASVLFADEGEKKYDYIGANKCKMCHKKDGTHTTWLETKHAKAFEALDADAQKNQECVGCHTTGTTAKGELLEGVQCEACHGPGSAYKSMKIMKDPELAMANGLMLPDTTTCMGCHNENVPEEFQPKDGYNFTEMMKTGIHAMPAKKEGK